MPHICSRCLVLFAVVLLAAGCKKKLPDPDSAGPAPAAAHTGAPLTEADCRQFGEDLVKAVSDGDKATVARLFRVPDLFERSVSDLGLTPNDKKAVLAGGSAAADKFVEGILAECRGGNYSVLRTRTIDGRPRVLLRVLGPEGGVNYHEFTLARYADGQIATEDVYIYLTGEPLTQTLRRLLLGYLAGRDLGTVGRLSKPEQLLAKHADDLRKMSTQVRSGQHKEALATFRRLPEELRKNKVFHLIALQAAMGSGDDKEYLAEMERFRRDHPTDVSADVVSIDYYLLKKNHDESIRLLDRLDKSLGGDPYLTAVKAGVLADAGRFKEARTLAEKAIEDAPKLPQVYWIRVTVALREGDHADTLKWLKKFVETVEPALEPAALSADGRFVEFVKTPQFQDFKMWLANRGK